MASSDTLAKLHLTTDQLKKIAETLTHLQDEDVLILNEFVRQLEDPPTSQGQQTPCSAADQLA